MLKRDSNMGVFLGIFQKVLGTTYFIEQLQWLFLKYVSLSEKNFKKKKVSGEIAFELIILFHVQI